MSEISDTAHNGDEPRPSHEWRDLSPRSVALFGALLAAVIATVLAVNFGLLKITSSLQSARRPAPSPLEHTRESTPEPRLQVNGAKELRELRAAEEALLTSYGWVDKEAGMVRIPITRAMEILGQQGLPARGAANRSQATPRRRNDQRVGQ